MPLKSKIIPDGGNGGPRFEDWFETSKKTADFSKKLSLSKRGLVDLPCNDYQFENFQGYASFGRDKAGLYPPYYCLYNGSVVPLLSIFSGLSMGLGLPGPERDELGSLKKRLQTQLYQKATEKIVNLPVAVFEMKKTFEAFANVGRSLYESMNHMLGLAGRTRSPEQAINLLIRGTSTGGFPSRRESVSTLGDGLANRWLEWSFAIKPTLSDLAATARDMQDGFSDKRKKRLHFSTEDQVFLSLSKGNPGAYNGVWQALNAHMRGKGYMCAEVDSPIERKIQEYGLDDPLSWAWELLPFSFVVDWFAPVGDWLSGLKPIRGMQFKYGYLMYHAKGIAHRTRRVQNGSASVGKIRYLSKRRENLSSFPTPTWEGYDPNGYGPRQVGHTMALLWQLMRR